VGSQAAASGADRGEGRLDAPAAVGGVDAAAAVAGALQAARAAREETPGARADAYEAAARALAAALGETRGGEA
jgi:hypothetical protein